MIEIELEKTYLVKKLPSGLAKFPHKEIIDMYIPAQAAHPALRLRKKGDKFEMTKKQPIHGTDWSEQEEHTIKLNKEEFGSLINADGKKVCKIRYDYTYDDNKAEIDVFKGDLEGLVLVDFEFTDVKKKKVFKMPDFCLIDVTQDETFAGGMLCGKKYSDIEPRLHELGYMRIDLV
jgi:CYTH domain-containing protein